MKKLAIATVVAIAAVASIASAQQRPAAAQAPANQAAVRTVGSLVASGFNIVSVLANPMDSKQLLYVVQKGGEAYTCPIQTGSVAFAMAGGCIKAQ